MFTTCRALISYSNMNFNGFEVSSITLWWLYFNFYLLVIENAKTLQNYTRYF